MSLSHVHTTMKPTKNRVIIFGILSLIVVTSILNSIQIYFIATFEQPYPLHPISEYTQNIDLTKVPPRGSPPNLPSLKTSKSKRFEKNLTRKEQGIVDGFITSDTVYGISPRVWKVVLAYMGVKSILDVGCGRGVSTSWFYLQGVKVQCVEGRHEAFHRNMLLSILKEKDENMDTSKVMIEHDFSLGPWWPEETVDMVWCVNFLEQDNRNFEKNYLAALKKAAFIVVSYSGSRGGNDTDTHESRWWKTRFTMNGFVYSHHLTRGMQTIAFEEGISEIPFPLPEVHKTYNVQYLRDAAVFINPAVASKVEHKHLLSEPGCFTGDQKPNHHCGHNTKKNSQNIYPKIPDEFLFTPYKESAHIEWENYMKKMADEAR